MVAIEAKSEKSSARTTSTWITTCVNIYKLGRIPFTFEAPFWSLLGSLFFYAAYDKFYATSAILSFGLVFLTNVSINYANEYFDYEADKLTAQRPDSMGSHGGSKILVRGILPRWSALAAAGVVQAFILVCIFLSRHFEGEASSLQGFVLTFGLFNMFIAQQYVGPPLRLHYNGGGEIVSSSEISSGPVLYGFLAQVTTFKHHGLSFSESMALLTPTMRLFLLWAFFHELGRIFVMHIADIREDVAAKKYTLVSLVGYRRARVLYISAQLLAAFLAFNIVLIRPRAAWLMGPVYLVKIPCNIRTERRMLGLVHGDTAGFEGISVLASVEVLVTAVMLVIITLVAGDVLDLRT